MFGMGRGMKVISPWSAQRGYKGARRAKGGQPKSGGKHRRGSGIFPGVRLTPLNDRVRGFFR